MYSEPYLAVPRNTSIMVSRDIKEDVKTKVLSSRTVLNGGEREQEHGSGASEKGVLSQGQPKWWRAGQRTFSPKGWSSVRDIKEDVKIKVLSPRTDLNGGEPRAGQTKRQKEEIEDRPRTNLNGAELVQSTFLVLTFAFALAFMSTFVLTLILAFLSPFRGKVMTFLGCNSILVPCGIILLGAFGWAFAFAHGILSRVACHRSAVKAEGPGGMPIVEEEYNYVRYPVCGEGGGVFPRGAGASGALVLVLEAAGCGRRTKVCLGRFILRHAVAATSSSLSFSACLPIKEGSNCWIVSSLQK